MPVKKRNPPRRPQSRTHRPQSRYPLRRVRRRWTFRILTGFAALLVVVLLWAIIARATTPHANTTRQSFDAILVLGTPADSDGNPTPQLLDRITEGVHEYERGVAPRLIVSGAAAHNRFVEADVMARVAQAQGVPSSRIFEERQAIDTIQNACYATAIMRDHGWHSVEVVSAVSHLPRAAMIFQNLPGPKLEWRVHPAKDNVSPSYYGKGSAFVETLKTARYLLWTRWIENCR